MAASSPSHVVWFVRKIEGRDKDLWTRIGAGWEHKSGKGINLIIDLYPNAAGKIVVLEKKDQPEGDVAGSYDPNTGEIAG